MSPRKAVKTEKNSDGEETVSEKTHPSTRMLRKREWDSARYKCLLIKLIIGSWRN